MYGLARKLLNGNFLTAQLLRLVTTENMEVLEAPQIIFFLLSIHCERPEIHLHEQQLFT